jgi:hypothetical protein
VYRGLRYFIILYAMAWGDCAGLSDITHFSLDNPEATSISYKSRKKTKTKKKKVKKRKKREKVYSEKNIEKILKNDNEDGKCNRLTCASNLKIAKLCLKTKADHRENKNCFRAFCAYGCNEIDYKTKSEVYDFCNLKCSSKKYLKNKKRPK